MHLIDQIEAFGRNYPLVTAAIIFVLGLCGKLLWPPAKRWVISRWKVWHQKRQIVRTLLLLRRESHSFRAVLYFLRKIVPAGRAWLGDQEEDQPIIREEYCTDDHKCLYEKYLGDLQRLTGHHLTQMTKEDDVKMLGYEKKRVFEYRLDKDYAETLKYMIKNRYYRYVFRDVKRYRLNAIIVMMGLP